jgi:hypothetical protein
MITEITKSLDWLCSVPEAMHILEIKKYKKDKKMRNWDKLERSLPGKARQEFVTLFRSTVKSYSRPYYDHILTWKAIDEMVKEYRPDALNLLRFLKSEIKENKFPLS